MTRPTRFLALRPHEDILTLLTRAGYSGPDALHIYRALFGFLHGHVLNELQELVEKPDETDDLLRLRLHRLPIGEFPLLRSLASALASYDGAAELERGLDILLTGLTTTLTPAPGESPPRRPGTREPNVSKRPAGPVVRPAGPATTSGLASGTSAGVRSRHRGLACRRS